MTMLWIKDHTDRIRDLLSTDTSQSVTYAALEARLAIELVCYERLRIAHDYLPHEEVRRWQPAQVVNTLIAEVDPHIASDYTFSISNEPAPPKEEVTERDFEKVTFVEVGRQVGFNPALMGRLWNSLGNFLHVKLPTSQTDSTVAYGDKEVAKRKIGEVLTELDRLATGTLISSGFGAVVSFTCECGSPNKRRASLLSAGKVVHCIKPECKETYEVSYEGDDVFFERRKIAVHCYSCGKPQFFPRHDLETLPHDYGIKFDCDGCGKPNAVQWRLCYAKPPDWQPESTDAQRGPR